MWNKPISATWENFPHTRLCLVLLRCAVHIPSSTISIDDRSRSSIIQSMNHWIIDHWIIIFQIAMSHCVLQNNLFKYQYQITVTGAPGVGGPNGEHVRVPVDGGGAVWAHSGVRGRLPAPREAVLVDALRRPVPRALRRLASRVRHPLRTHLRPQAPRILAWRGAPAYTNTSVLISLQNLTTCSVEHFRKNLGICLYYQLVFVYFKIKALALFYICKSAQ